MSVKSTVEITREQAIKIIVDKRIEQVKEDMKDFLERYHTNEELEELLDTKYYNSEFENYSIVEKNKGDE